ncbi:hypothetical protein DFP72DRAFT_1072346 [Ephemerocybe angulata]|uniref:Initiation factor eIF2 gamma C-terminal domain-containing protein n=1 Tax=Ephemerocybe angulata TaxID=980116 RepID=A0A8H6HPL3_9AGAR|nr:hypothetical protein DFP72DRAFT_1072346 [Tulosesus angulatus]
MSGSHQDEDYNASQAEEESIQWKIQLTIPACTEVGEKVALSRRIEKHWRLVGWGSVQRGTVLEVD